MLPVVFTCTQEDVNFYLVYLPVHNHAVIKYTNKQPDLLTYTWLHRPADNETKVLRLLKIFEMYFVYSPSSLYIFRRYGFI